MKLTENEILETESRQYKREGMLLGGDNVELMLLLGHPMGSSFRLEMAGGHVTYLKLTPLGISVHTDFAQPQKSSIMGLWLVWLLQVFAHQNNLSETFSSPMPESEIGRVRDFYSSLGAPEFKTMPVDELAERMKLGMADFWKNFKPGVIGDTWTTR
jgi:hypothetical protein